MKSPIISTSRKHSNNYTLLVNRSGRVFSSQKTLTRTLAPRASAVFHERGEHSLALPARASVRRTPVQVWREKILNFALFRLVFALFALSLAVELIDGQVAFEKVKVVWAKKRLTHRTLRRVATTKLFRDLLIIPTRLVQMNSKWGNRHTCRHDPHPLFSLSHHLPRTQEINSDWDEVTQWQNPTKWRMNLAHVFQKEMGKFQSWFPNWSSYFHHNW